MVAIMDGYRKKKESNETKTSGYIDINSPEMRIASLEERIKIKDGVISDLEQKIKELEIRLDEAHRCLSAKNTVYTYPATVQYIEQEEMGENVIKGEGNEVDRDK